MANTTVACTNINLLKESQMPASPSQTELYAVEIGSIFEQIYPVGSIYITINSTCPLQTLIGGSTWEKIEDKYLVGAGTIHALGSTGGSTTNTHNHYQTVGGDGTQGFALTSSDTTNVPRSKVISPTESTTAKSIAYSGGRTSVRVNSTLDETINIEPPYISVNIFKRTA